MPLKNGKSDRTINSNVKELIENGHKRSEAISIALDHAGVDRKFVENTVKAKDQDKRPIQVGSPRG